MVQRTNKISYEYFKKRLLDLCLRSGLTGLPNGEIDRHILLRSMVLLFADKSAIYTEDEVNERLIYWLNNICELESLDHVTLRRLLVDSEYLTRSRDCTSYQVVGNQEQQFAPGIEEIDVEKIMESGKEEIARKKRMYMRLKQEESNK